MSLQQAGIWRKNHWVSEVMVSIGVPLADVVDGYRTLLENPHGSVDSTGVSFTPDMAWSWSEESAQLHLLHSTYGAVSQRVSKV